MRILIIRHGDPDYSIDSLTEKGWREAGLLAQRMLKEHITAFYASPLGRAQDTAKPTLDLYEKETGSRPEIKTLDWLHEFPARIDLDLTKCGAPEGTPTLHCPWNMPPQYWSSQPEFFTQEWRNHPMYMDKSCEVVPVFERVIKGWGDLMECHGYRRGAGSDGHPGYIYDVAPGTEKNQTIALFLSSRSRHFSYRGDHRNTASALLEVVLPSDVIGHDGTYGGKSGISRSSAGTYNRRRR